MSIRITINRKVINTFMKSFGDIRWYKTMETMRANTASIIFLETWFFMMRVSYSLSMCPNLYSKIAITKAIASVIYVVALVKGLSVNCMMTTICIRFSTVMIIRAIA